MRFPAKSNLLWLRAPVVIGVIVAGKACLERRAAYLRSADWNQFRYDMHGFRKNFPLESGKGMFYNPVLFDAEGKS